MTRTQYMVQAGAALAGVLGQDGTRDAVAVASTHGLGSELLDNPERDCTVWKYGEKTTVTCKVLRVVDRTFDGRTYKVPVYESVAQAVTRTESERALKAAEQQGEYIPEVTAEEMAAVRQMFS